MSFIIPRMIPPIGLKSLFLFIVYQFRFKSNNKAKSLVSEFERKFSERYNMPQGIGVCKARMALFYLLKHLPLRKKGDVLLSAIHIADYVNIIRLAGFNPVIVDLKPNTYNIDYEDLKKKISVNTSLVLITHLTGYATSMEKIIDITNQHEVPFIEDCSQALFSEYNGKLLGSFGVASIFSLCLNKTVSTVKGGMIISKDEDLLESIRADIPLLRRGNVMNEIIEAFKQIFIKLAVQPYIFRFFLYPLIYISVKKFDFVSNFLRTNKTVILRSKMPKQFFVPFTWQQAIIGLRELESMFYREERRIKNGLFIYNNIKSDKKLIIPERVKNSRDTFWLFPVIAKDPGDFRKYLIKYGIDSSRFLMSMVADEPAFKDYHFNADNARQLKSNTVFIPMYYTLTARKLNYIVEIVRKYQENKI